MAFARSAPAAAGGCAPAAPPGWPRYAVPLTLTLTLTLTLALTLTRTARETLGAKPPCAFGTYPTREAGARSPYVPYGGPAAYVSA